MDIVLQRNGLRLVLMPDLGGSVRTFACNGRNLLFPAADAPATPLETAAFPLFPFSGRIRDGRFAWNGRQVQLAPNFPPEPHAIHGQAWQAGWQVDSLGPDSVRLSYRHRPDRWPWAYNAVQTFDLLDNGLQLRLDLQNLSDEAMPAGLGWHPYFPREGASLSANVSAVWTAESSMIPNRKSPLGPDTDLSAARPVRGLRLDNAFAASPADAEIAWQPGGPTVSIRSSPELTHLVVFVPEGERFFCVEPVSHAPDAVNADAGPEVTGLRSLAPGETLTARIVLRIGEEAG